MTGEVNYINNKVLKYEWNSAKNARNKTKHGIGFEAAEGFDWRTAIEIYDSRDDYGEDRWVAFGFIGVALYVMAYTEHAENIRIICLRRATKNEEKCYAQGTETTD